ncbi:dihydrofolate reductase family protein [Fodinicola feengrottensis]|uniref:Dihydrofolate reductase family protein n=1 Tax=Fodinicola feengrottensis TaxID=435914 RepID=A0ABN2J5D7_9ACTN
MRKIVANLFISLDGVVESPEKWSMSYWSDDLEAVVVGGMANSDAMLVGRVTYDGFAAHWPNVTAEQDPAADHMNNTRKYVASTTLKAADWNNSVLLEGDLADSIAKIKAQDGGDIATVGSPTLVRSLLALGLVDELHLLHYPVVVGHGQRLFADDSYAVTLKEATTFSNGVQHLVYTPSAA